MKLMATTVLIGLFSLGLSPQIDSHLKKEKEVKMTDPTEIGYDDLPGFVREFMFKGYEVKPEDIQKIIRIEDGAFFVKMNRSVNVFGIDADVKMHQQKLDLVEVKTGNPMKRKMKEQKETKKRLVRNVHPSLGESEIAWSTMPAHVREYLVKRMAAAEDQVHKVYDLGNNKYKIVLKQAHNEFVIFEESPHVIAFEHDITNRLN